MLSRVSTNIRFADFNAQHASGESSQNNQTTPHRHEEDAKALVLEALQESRDITGEPVTEAKSINRAASFVTALLDRDEESRSRAQRAMDWQKTLQVVPPP